MSVNFHFFDLSVGRCDHLPVNQKSKGKFVQLQHKEDGEYIIFSPLVLCGFHAQIINLFSSLQDPIWAFELNSKEDDGELYEDDIEIIGGGYYEVFEDKQRLNLSGSSQAYGVYNNYGLDERLKQVEQFKDYSIFC